MSIFAVFMMPNSCINEQVIEVDNNGNGGGETPPVTKQYCRLSVKTTENTFGQDLNAKHLGLFVVDSKNQPVQTNNPVQLTSGYKEIEMAEGSDTIGSCYAYYPYPTSSAVATVTNGIYSGAVPTVQDQSVNYYDASTPFATVPSVVSDRLLMISTNSNSVNFKNQIASIQMKNVLSLIRIEVKASRELIESDKTFTSQRIKSMELYYSNGTDTLTPMLSIAGAYTIDLTKTPDAANYTGPNWKTYDSKLRRQYPTAL
jgi:hypothetical protein